MVKWLHGIIKNCFCIIYLFNTYLIDYRGEGLQAKKIWLEFCRFGFPFFCYRVVYHFRQGLLPQSVAPPIISIVWPVYRYHSLFSQEKTDFLLSQVL